MGAIKQYLIFNQINQSFLGTLGVIVIVYVCVHTHDTWFA